MASSSITIHDALKLFPEERIRLPERLSEAQADLAEATAEAERINEIRNRHVKRLQSEGKHADVIAVDREVENLPVFQEIERLRIRIFTYEGLLQKREIVFPEEIQKAKERPLHGLLPRTCKRRGDFYTCPFHKEKTPSFYVKKNNSYTCYGCGKYWDSINLVMELYNVGFKEAVRLINSYGL